MFARGDADVIAAGGQLSCRVHGSFHMGAGWMENSLYSLASQAYDLAVELLSQKKLNLVLW